MQHADQAEVAWDADSKRWVVRVQVGGEVIRGPFKYARHEVDAGVLRTVAIQMVREEGYDLNAETVVVHR